MTPCFYCSYCSHVITHFFTYLCLCKFFIFFYSDDECVVECLVEYIVFKKKNLHLAFFLIKQKWSFWLYFLSYLQVQLHDTLTKAEQEKFDEAFGNVLTYTTVSDLLILLKSILWDRLFSLFFKIFIQNELHQF